VLRPIAFALAWVAIFASPALAQNEGSTIPPAAERLDEPNEAQATRDEGPAIKEQGAASIYANKFQGRKTAEGEPFRQNALTAASKTLPLGAKAKVTNEENGRSVEVKINDRGPYVDGRIIDLSKKAAKELDMEKQGVAPVTVEVKPKDQPTPELKEKVRQEAENRAE
jgi:rare lipoprotein A